MGMVDKCRSDERRQDQKGENGLHGGALNRSYENLRPSSRVTTRCGASTDLSSGICSDFANAKPAEKCTLMLRYIEVLLIPYWAAAHDVVEWASSLHAGPDRKHLLYTVVLFRAARPPPLPHLRVSREGPVVLPLPL